MAGHDTTSTSLSSALYFLAKHPDVQEKAREELNKVMAGRSSDAVPTVEDQKQFHYLSCVIKETMRMLPPLGNLPFRFTPEETQLGSLTLPKMTGVQVEILGLHHSAYEKEDVFMPERFMGNDGKVKVTLESNDEYKWLAFGAGTRVCIGMHFSIQEQRVILCILLRLFKVKLSHEGQEIKVNRGVLLNPTELPLLFESI